jgi:alpha-L-fucosidase 2
MKILVDGKEAFSTGKVSSGSYRAEVQNISVAGAKELILVVTDGDNRAGGDHASWGDAYLTLAD